MNKPKTLIEVKGVQKKFTDGSEAIQVLQDIHLSLNHAERIAIVGPSGSGKSTLLHLLGGLDFPSHGSIEVMGKDWKKLSEKERCTWRNQVLGFVYQFHHLLPELSALENTMLPLMMQDLKQTDIESRAKELLEHMGLGKRLTHRPHQLSGGERQRVAIARAMVTSPRCILADEPTGNLDQTTAHMVLNLWNELNQKAQTAMVVVTHDLTLAKKMDRVYQLVDGHLGEM
ncbi:MAG TPA: lipoprotein-releasing system ATP-binding protein LolD [Legionellales bacterium]|nr:lipoprotein-releasing system ATP-binding protein LolD [Legionellales bacterium]